MHIWGDNNGDKDKDGQTDTHTNKQNWFSLMMDDNRRRTDTSSNRKVPSIKQVKNSRSVLPSPHLIKYTKKTGNIASGLKLLQRNELGSSNIERSAQARMKVQK